MIDRRHLILGLGAPLVLHRGMALAGPDDAPMPMRAIERYRLGDMDIAVIDDGSFSMPLTMFTGGASAAERDAFMAAHDMAKPAVHVPLQVMLVQHEGQRILIDTGLGDVTMHGGAPDHGRLTASLAELGLGPGDIDTVILTHGHPDHIGGLTVEAAPQFAQARHLLPQAEFDFWTQNPERAPAGLRPMIEECRRHLLPLAHRITSYGDGDVLAPGITAVAAPGHTRAHFAIRLESRGERLLNLVDTAVFLDTALEHPDWTIGADLDKAQAVATRQRLFAEMAETGELVAAAHFPFPGVGRIARAADGYTFHPVKPA